VGNSLEVAECIDVLNGGGPEDLCEICLVLAAWMFLLGRRVADLEEGKRLAREMIAGGKAKEKFRQMIGLQGGNPAVVDNPGLLPRAKYQTDIASSATGTVTAMMVEQMGTAGVLLGGGREKKEDTVDPSVGIMVHKKLGDNVSAGEALCTVYYNSSERLERARPLIVQSYKIESASSVASRPLIGRVIEGEGVRAAGA
jgi:thymidine phosphorylase